MYIIFAIVFFRIEKLTIARYIEQNYMFEWKKRECSRSFSTAR